jgi:hypothetical protein
MSTPEPLSRDANHEARILKFRRRGSSARAQSFAASPVADLAKYERSDETDDYRHRMMVNAAAFVFVLVLIGAGLWLTDSMARLRRNQDCVLAGHPNCAPIKIIKSR